MTIFHCVRFICWLLFELTEITIKLCGVRMKLTAILKQSPKWNTSYALWLYISWKLSCRKRQNRIVDWNRRAYGRLLRMVHFLQWYIVWYRIHRLNANSKHFHFVNGHFYELASIDSDWKKKEQNKNWTFPVDFHTENMNSKQYSMVFLFKKKTSDAISNKSDSAFLKYNRCRVDASKCNF